MQVLVLHVDQPQLVNKPGHGVSVVDNVRCPTTSYRTFGCQVNAPYSHLERVFKVAGVTRPHLHVKHARYGIAVLCRKGR